VLQRVSLWAFLLLQVLSEACDLVMIKYNASKTMLSHGAQVIMNGH
jgi:hypothetical protein